MSLSFDNLDADTNSATDLKKVLRDILDPSNHPLLIHCNKGKHRTGSVVGCLRKIRDWSLSSIVSFVSSALSHSLMKRMDCCDSQRLLEDLVYARHFSTEPYPSSRLLRQSRIFQYSLPLRRCGACITSPCRVIYLWHRSSILRPPNLSHGDSCILTFVGVRVHDLRCS
jgi:Tyrosine phosphatase family